MPHITVKMFAGRTEEQKATLAVALADALKNTLGSTDASISIAIEDVAKEDWKSKVYEPEIAPQLGTLYKKPGY